MRENGNGTDGDLTSEIQAPPPVAGDAPTQAGHEQAAPSPDPLAAASAGPGKRGKLRRRLSKLKGVRARQRAELGTLVLDARKRSNGSRPEVVDRRAAEAAEVDRQVRELQHVVNPHADARELIAGIAGSCHACGSILSTEDRFCPSCGAPTKRGRARPADAAPEAAAPEAATPAEPTPPPPSQDTPLAHVDRSAIPPPPPPAG